MFYNVIIIMIIILLLQLFFIIILHCPATEVIFIMSKQKQQENKNIKHKTKDRQETEKWNVRVEKQQIEIFTDNRKNNKKKQHNQLKWHKQHNNT